MPGFKPLKPSACSRVAAKPFACTTLALQLATHSSWPSAFQHCSLPFACTQVVKAPTTSQTLQFPRGSFHQAWPSAFAAPGLQPALCLHIPRDSFHQAPGRQRSSIAACPLPAHSLLLLGHSSLPFARLQTPKTLRGNFPKTPQTFACSSR